MIYTIGDPTSYEGYIRDAYRRADIPFKMGKREDYEGGIVWKTIEEAQAYLLYLGERYPYRVYGVIASWDEDTDAAPGREGASHRYLLRDSPLVRIHPAPSAVTRGSKSYGHRGAVNKRQRKGSVGKRA